MKKTTPQKKRTSKKTNPVAVFETSADARTALLIISLLINLAVVSLWIALQLTSQYDAALIDFFINR